MRAGPATGSQRCWRAPASGAEAERSELMLADVSRILASKQSGCSALCASGGGITGIFFEMEGGLGGVLAATMRVSSNICLTATREVLDAMASDHPPRQAVLALGKKAFYEQLEMPLNEAYQHTSKVIVDNMMMRDAEIGIGAFIDKTKPEWEDR